MPLPSLLSQHCDNASQNQRFRPDKLLTLISKFRPRGRTPPSLTNVAGQPDSGLSDETLLQRLAGDNLELRKQLEGLLGSEDFEKAAPAPPKPAPTITPNSTTKH